MTVYHNGKLLWTRVRGADGRMVRRSTGTANRVLAEQIERVVLVLRDDPRAADLVMLVADGSLEMRTLYDAHLTGRLAELRATINDVDLSCHVDHWLAQVAGDAQVSPSTCARYEQQIRTLIPDGERFPLSRLTPDTVRQWLAALNVASTSTKRRYFDALRVFVRYLLDAGVVAQNPLSTMRPPKNAPPRTRYFEHPDRMRALGAMMPDQLEREWVTLAMATGMEAGAIASVRWRDFAANGIAVYAHGTKNGYRSRVCFIDQWGREALASLWMRREGADQEARVFEGTNPDRVRDAFYVAQAALGLARDGDWHTLHDCRHTYCVNRLQGLDGEPARDLQYCADQLGHGNTVMVSRIYGKFRMRDRAALEALLAPSTAHTHG